LRDADSIRELSAGTVERIDPPEGLELSSADPLFALRRLLIWTPGVAASGSGGIGAVSFGVSEFGVIVAIALLIGVVLVPVWLVFSRDRP
jgi:hypothetical protein